MLFLKDVTLQALREKVLRQKLKLDQQTKVLNKVSLLRSLDALLRTERRGPLSVCMVDFDDFKAVNDRYGHLMGDRVLDTFCRIARENIRAGDLLGRFGGEEFLFVLRADRGQAAFILRRIQNDLRESFAGTVSFPVTFSAGVVSCGKGHCGWKEIVEEADRWNFTPGEAASRIRKSPAPGRANQASDLEKEFFIRLLSSKRTLPNVSAVSSFSMSAISRLACSRRTARFAGSASPRSFLSYRPISACPLDCTAS